MRRRVLAALATGSLGATAGCGYAYGGGDVRDTATPVTSAALGDRYYDASDGRFALASSGMQWVRDENGEMDFTEATTVAVSNRNGDRLWSYEHLETSVAVALGDRAFLLDDAQRVVAVDATRSDDQSTEPSSARSGGTSLESDEAWRVALDDPQPPIAADGRGAYLVDDGSLVAVRDGSIAWERALPSPAESLLPAGEGVLAATETATVAFGPDGDRRWERRTDGAATVAAGGDRTVLRQQDGLAGDVTVVRTTDGDRLWSAAVRGRGAEPAVTDEAVYLVAGSAVEAYDAASGEKRWSASAAGVDAPLVPAPEGVYGTRGCEAVAVGRDGLRWRRELDRDRCTVVDGWLDGETVALRFASGAIVWLQRTDQEPGLL